MYHIQEPSGALFLYVKAEKFPIVCQAGAVRCTREMNPCLSTCFKLKTEKQSLRKHLWRGSFELPSVPSLAFQLREVPEESNWYAWGSSMPGYWAAWQLDWGRVAAVWKGTRHVGEGWGVPERRFLLSTPQDLGTCRPDSCQWWLRHLWANLRVFHPETITGVVPRQDWAPGHRSCHAYCWDWWIMIRWIQQVVQH